MSVRIRVIGRLVVVTALLGAALVGVRWFEDNRARAGEFTDEYLHERGTTSKHLDFSESIEPRPVDMQPLERRGADLLYEYARRVARGEPLGGVQAEYDPEADEIRVVGDEVRFEATLPEPLRGGFYHTIRHEYGHAAYFDWMDAQQLAAQDVVTISAATPENPPADEIVPPALRSVVEEWGQQDPNIYVDPYFMSNFAEYIAESYARVLSGLDVPPLTRAFIVEEYGGQVLEENGGRAL